MPTRYVSQPKCPRCGYDQSGAAVGWTASCPLEGICPECGHGFAWIDLFDPSRQDVLWSVESGETRRARLLKTPGMAARMVLPWIYWRGMTVDAPMHPVRLLSWFIVLVLVLQVGSWPLVTLAVGLSEFGVWPLTLNAIEEVFDGADGHLVRIGTNGICWLVLYWGEGWSGPWPMWFNFNDVLVRLVRFSVGVCMVWCTLLAVLPATRRLVKLRFGHVFRAAIMQIASLVLLIALWRILFFVAMLVPDSGQPLLGMVTVSSLIAIWSLVWWASALRIGWSIRSRLLQTLGSVAAILGGLVATFIEHSIWYIFR